MWRCVPTPATRGAPRGCAVLWQLCADRDVTLDGFGTARDVVRVVAREAGHLAALKARRLAQAVRAAGDLELVVAPRCPGRVIEMDEVVAQRLPRRVRKRRMLVSRESETAAACSWTRGDTACTFRAGGRDRVSRGSRSLGRPASMSPAFTASTCACPGPWQRWQSMPSGRVRARTEPCGPLRRARLRPSAARIAVVAGHAPRIDDAPEVEMRGPVVPRAHRPIALSRRSDGCARAGGHHVRRTSSPAFARAARRRFGAETCARDCPSR